MIWPNNQKIAIKLDKLFWKNLVYKSQNATITEEYNHIN